MQVDYSWLKKPAVLPKLLAVAASLLALPLLSLTMRTEKVAVVPSNPVKLSQPARPDPRTIRLTKFFARLHCPVASLASDFIRAADENHLDWRLLPSISVIESGGGKAYKNNNIFGWNNGDQPFPSIRAGINEVAFRLGRGRLYSHRDSIGKLRLYNPNEGYVNTVLDVMNRISPVEDLKPQTGYTRN
jgi:hypothetical protein